MSRGWRVVGAVAGGLAAGALAVAAMRVGWLLQWPRALLGGLLVAAAVTALGLLSLAGDLVGPGRWPDPPEPERVAGWPQLVLVAGALRKTAARGRSIGPDRPPDGAGGNRRGSHGI